MAVDHHIRRYFPIVAGALLALVAYFQASGISALVAGSLYEPAPLSLLERPTVLPRRTRAVSAKPILARNVFDSETGPLDGSAAPAVPPPSQDGQDAPGNPLEDPKCDFARATLIVASDDPAWSFVAIEQKGGENTLRRAGDKVGEHTVSFVAWDRAWLSSSSGRCQLKVGDQLERGSTPRRTPSPEKPERASRRSSRLPKHIADKIHKIGENQYAVDRAAIDEILGDQATLFRAIRVRPIKEGEDVKGMRLSRIRSGTLLHTLGIRSGDVVHSINGFQLTDPQKALQAYGRLRTADGLKIAVTRNGKPVTIDIGIQ